MRWSKLGSDSPAYGKAWPAMAAFALGALAIAGNPYGGGGKVTIHPQELATLVHGEVDHVTVHQLADWIVQGRSDYRLIDLRDPQVFAAYHIPTAENVPLTDLPGDVLARNEKSFSIPTAASTRPRPGSC